MNDLLGSRLHGGLASVAGTNPCRIVAEKKLSSYGRQQLSLLLSPLSKAGTVHSARPPSCKSPGTSWWNKASTREIENRAAANVASRAPFASLLARSFLGPFKLHKDAKALPRPASRGGRVSCETPLKLEKARSVVQVYLG